VRAERSARRVLAVAALLAAVACGRENTPDANEIVLDEPTGRIDGIEATWNLVELPDGRVAFAQARVPAVVRADLATGAQDTIGRKGSGPGEYQAPGRVHLKNGRLGVFDFQLYRLTTWNDDGTVLESSTIPPRATFAMQLDSLGYVYYEQMPAHVFIGGDGGPDPERAKDSTWIFRTRAEWGARTDTVARRYEIGQIQIRMGDGAMFLPRLYQSPDAWGVLRDGTIWIARGRENRIDRRAPDGAWTIGTPRPFTPIPTSTEDRKKVQPFRPFPGADTIYQPMAEEKGPFSEAVAAEEGEVWTRIHQPRGFTRERYAIFPVAGASTRTVSLPLGRRVLAISAAHVYAVTEDDDGFWSIERYPRPGARE
jgi:hypothetical protein